MTAADFYLGRGPSARWIGSLRPQADPAELAVTPPGRILLAATASPDYARAVEDLLALPAVIQNGGGSRPADGWPWSWPDSSLTGWCYAFDTAGVWISYFGRAWFTCPLLTHTDFDEAVDRLRRSSSDGPRATFPPQLRQPSTVGSTGGA